jgi:hypothetical protein
MKDQLYKDCAQQTFQMLNLDEAWIIVDFKVIKTEISVCWCWIKFCMLWKCYQRKRWRNVHLLRYYEVKIFITLNEMNNTTTVSSANLQWIVESWCTLHWHTVKHSFMIECLSQNLIDVRLKHIKMIKWVM